MKSSSISFRSRGVDRRPWRGNPAAVLVATGLLVGYAAGCAPREEEIVERPKIGQVREKETVRLTGLAPLRGWGEHRDCSLMHCLEVTIEALGRAIDYDELMGLSGMAFRAQFRTDVWDTGNPDPLVGEECLSGLMAAIGFEYALYTPDRSDPRSMAQVRDAIVASIDYSFPVLATNLIPPENWGIITGYRDKGQKLWCRTYDYSSQNLDQLAKEWPSAVLVLTRKLSLPDRTAARRGSLQRAVALISKTRTGEYAQGRNAIETWCRMLEKAADRDYLQANAWTYVSLIDARSAAARYLRRLSSAPDFAADRVHLTRAANAYERERQVLIGAIDYVKFPADVRPGTLPSASTRQQQVKALRQAALCEEEAVTALRRIRR